MLTEWASWRWCLYVNLVIAAIALVGAMALLAKREDTHRPKLDIPGTLTVSAALFGIVYGFSHAANNGWVNAVTLGSLAAGVVLLAVFVLLQAKVGHPLLPLRILADRNRAASLLAVLVTGAGMFAVFLFLTYYLQTVLNYSPITTGVAFMPMIVMLVIAATTSTAQILPRFGPKWLMTSGMVIAALGMGLLTQIDVHSSYPSHILPGLVVLGLGIGAVMAPAMQGAISGVNETDAGVASATVNTVQQVGGSVGTALLSTVAATAVTDFLQGKLESPGVLAEAAVHSYTTTFWWASGIFAVGALITGLLMRPGLLPATPEGAVVVG